MDLEETLYTIVECESYKTCPFQRHLLTPSFSRLSDQGSKGAVWACSERLIVRYGFPSTFTFPLTFPTMFYCKQQLDIEPHFHIFIKSIVGLRIFGSVVVVS
jgi:hypothetical protein